MKSEKILEDLQNRLGHLEAFYGTANHELSLKLADAERKILRLEQALLEVVRRAPLEDIGSDGRNTALWTVVKEAMESAQSSDPNQYMKDYWDVLAKANHRHTILASFDNDNERFYCEETPYLDGFNEQFSLFDSSSRVLDVGCGAGRIVYALRNRVKSIVGVDISATMIELAREVAPEEQCEFVVGNGKDLAFLPDNSIDFAYSLLVLQHMRQDVMFDNLKEVARILAPQGKFLFSLPSAGGYDHPRVTSEDLWSVQMYDRAEITSHLSESGLSLVEIVTRGNQHTVDDYFVFEKK